MEKNLKVLINEETLQKRIEELAEQINKDYEGKEIFIICVLKGAVFFTIDLAKRIKLDTKMEFIQLSSYGSGTESTGNIKLKREIETDLQGKELLIVEDIIDTGNSMKYLIEHLNEKQPASIRIASLLSKPERREVEVAIDYEGFEIPNKFVVGYGLDYDEKYRNLPFVGYLE